MGGGDGALETGRFVVLRDLLSFLTGIEDEEDLEDFDIDLDLEDDENDTMGMESPSVVRKAPLEDDTF